MFKANLLSAFFPFFFFHLLFAALFSSDHTSDTVYPGPPLPLLLKTSSSLPQQNNKIKPNKFIHLACGARGS